MDFFFLLPKYFFLQREETRREEIDPFEDIDDPTL
jgi:hypothetical protein